jgi:hypothetical protein
MNQARSSPIAQAVSANGTGTTSALRAGRALAAEDAKQASISFALFYRHFRWFRFSSATLSVAIAQALLLQ